MSYIRFGLMILTSTVVMFVLMYLNTYAWEHIFFSETRAYMAFVMGATMAVIMLAFMLGMYTNTTLNIAIFIGGVIVFAGALWLVRSQATVSGSSYMRAMIPHHSIAIMTSERAQITDPRVRKLAHEIIGAQQREIAEMRYLIAELSRKEGSERPDIYEDPPAEVGTVADALGNTLIATLDPAPLPAAEADQVLEAGPRCAFRLTAEADPILWSRGLESDVPSRGVMKLNGVIVPLDATEAGNGGRATFAADGATMTVRRLADEDDTLGGWRSDAELVLGLEQGLTVGYRGFYDCER